MAAALRVPVESVPPKGKSWRGGNARLWSTQLSGAAVVCKEYDPDYLTSVDKSSLEQLVQLKELLGLRALDVEAVTIWPFALLTRGSRGVCGVIMPPLDTSFLHLDDDRYTARTVDLLAQSRGFAERAERRYFEFPERLMVLGNALRALCVLHSADVIVNDLQVLNTAFEEEVWRVRFLDCDSMHGPWGQPVGKIRPADYAHGHDLGPEEDDLAKFAIMAINVLQFEWGTVPVRRRALSQFLPNDHIDLLDAALNGDIAPMRDWAGMGVQWCDSILPDGRMFVRTGGGGLKLWEAGMDTAEPEPGPVPPVFTWFPGMVPKPDTVTLPQPAEITPGQGAQSHQSVRASPIRSGHGFIALTIVILMIGLVVVLVLR